MFTSVLNRSYRGTLERLLFFNTGQDTVSDALSSAINRFGIPCISEVDGRLQINFDSGVAAQSLFALDEAEVGDRLAGMVVYVRIDDTFVVPLVAVHDEYTVGGAKGGERLFFRLVDEVIKIARRVKGVSSIALYTRQVTPLRIPVN